LQQKAKGRRTISPVLLPFPAGDKGAMVLSCGGFYPKGARHNGFLCEPERRAALCPALALCIRRRYVTSRHNCQRSRQDRELCGGDELAGCHALAACKPQAPGGVFREVRSGEAAAETKCAQRSEGGKPMAGYAFGALSGWHGVALAGGLRITQQDA